MNKTLLCNIKKGLSIAAVALLLASLYTSSATAVSDNEPAPVALSTYWHSKILRWESLIVQAANNHQLDPDFLASLVWMESRGDPYAVGPVGAVGLMQLMPKEAGFTWRPSREALMDPGTNLTWGSRTLATVIRQGRGDIFNSLAAYNGGWNQVMYRGPTIFATTILRDYAHAVALRYQLEGSWIAFFARQDVQIKGPIWIADSERSDVYFYGNENSLPEGTLLIPDIDPSAVIAYAQDEKTGDTFNVGVWIYKVQKDEWVNNPSLLTSLSFVEMASSTETVTPVSTNTPVATQPAVIAASPLVTPTPDTKEVQAPEVPCEGGELAVDAWPLGITIHPQGWSVTIFAEGHGGDCYYTYAWNAEEDVKGEAVAGPITFEIGTPRRDAAILGTVVVSSASETVRIPLYIPSPKK